LTRNESIAAYSSSSEFVPTLGMRPTTSTLNIPSVGGGGSGTGRNTLIGAGSSMGSSMSGTSEDVAKKSQKTYHHQVMRGNVSIHNGPVFRKDGEKKNVMKLSEFSK
jgi:hypothetical protein